MSNEVSDFLGALKKLNDSDSINILVPSIEREVKFKPFSVKQHKDLIKTAFDGIQGSVLMYKVFNDIIEENSSESVEYYIYDRNKILIDLRKKSVGDKVKIDGSIYSLESLPAYSIDDKFKKPTTIKDKNISVKVELPTLQLDSKVTEKSVFEFNKFSSEEKKIGNSVNILVSYELIKYIKAITIDDNVADFSSFTFADKKSIVDNLPLNLTNKILEYIASYKECEQASITFEDGKTLSIDASFLSIE